MKLNFSPNLQMASCALTSDYSFGCSVGSGGTQQCWIIETANISSYTESSGTLTAITKATGTLFRKYQLVLETGVFTEDIVGNRANGTLYYDQKGTIVLNLQQVAVRNEIMLLAVNNLTIVILDNNGAYRLFGRINGMRLLTGSAATGATFADRNGYTLNFEGKEAQLAPFVSAAAVLTLQIPG